MHAYGYRPDNGPDGYVDDGDASYGDDGYGDDTYGDDYEEGDRSGTGGPFRGAAADLVWRYRSAPLWARVTADVTAAVLAVGLVVGVSLALRSSAGPEDTSATGPTTTAGGDATTSVATTQPPTTLATTTTTEAPTTTTASPTSAAPPTRTAPPTTAPPVRAPGPPTTRNPTTTEVQRRRYHSCFDALAAGALPLRRGDPGYSRDLDRDGDGVACEPGEWT